MVKLSEILDIEKLVQCVDEGYIDVQKHPTQNLWIYNYSKRTQREWWWTHETTLCRGIIVDVDDYIVARPFPKFFDIEGMSRSDIVFSKPFKVQEKLDGSLMIMYWNQAVQRHFMASRGSFASEQALRGSEILRDKYPNVVSHGDRTYLFELIDPGNRIVVNYGNTSDVILLACIDNKTGDEVEVCDEMASCCNMDQFPRVREYNVADLKPREILEHYAEEGKDGTLAEGFVCVFDWPKGQKTRVKLKFDDYKRLHRVVFGITSRVIWDVLRNEKPLESVIANAPEEHAEWAEAKAKELLEKHAALVKETSDEFERLVRFAQNMNEDIRTLKDCARYFRYNRKNFSYLVKTSKITDPPALFLLLDGTEISERLWTICRPEAETPFTIKRELAHS